MVEGTDSAVEAWAAAGLVVVAAAAGSVVAETVVDRTVRRRADWAAEVEEVGEQRLCRRLGAAAAVAEPRVQPAETRLQRAAQAGVEVRAQSPACASILGARQCDFGNQEHVLREVALRRRTLRLLTAQLHSSLSAQTVCRHARGGDNTLEDRNQLEVPQTLLGQGVD